MDFSFARSATKHGIPRRDSARVIEQARFFVEMDPPESSTHTDVRRVYVGLDSSGQKIEVVAVAAEEGVLRVIHAMRLRRKTIEFIEGKIK